MELEGYKEHQTNERSDVTASKGGILRPPWKSVKKNRAFSVKNEKLFERSDVTASKRGFLRPPWKSVKKNRVFSVKNEKLFERSEFFSFRKMR